MFASKNYDVEKQLSIIPSLDHCHEKVEETDESNATTIDLELANDDIVNTVKDNPEEGYSCLWVCIPVMLFNFTAMLSVNTAVTKVNLWVNISLLWLLVKIDNSSSDNDDRQLKFFVFWIGMLTMCFTSLAMLSEHAALTNVSLVMNISLLWFYAFLKSLRLSRKLLVYGSSVALWAVMLVTIKFDFLEAVTCSLGTSFVMYYLQVRYPERFWSFLVVFLLVAAPLVAAPLVLLLGKGAVLIFSVANYVVIEPVVVGATHLIAEHPFFRASGKEKSEDHNENDGDKETVERQSAMNRRHNQTP